MRGAARHKGRHKVRRRDELLFDILRVRPGGAEADLHRGAAKSLFVHSGQQFDGYEHPIARLHVVEQRDLFQVVAQRDAATVEVDDLGHRSICISLELKADVCSR